MLHVAQCFRLPQPLTLRPVRPVRLRLLHSTAQRGHDEKLRILFCGSDLFSLAHLQALREYQLSGESNIESIDVVTKTDKRTGRGLKKISESLTKPAAVEYGYPVHQIDSFTGWTAPNINLVIAVSFGLLIPARIIRGSTYGGLNVHPSLLPDLRGAAPLQWAIIHGREHTGVSVQTLHHTKFDHGKVLLQSGPVKIPNTVSIHGLREQLEKIGAALLISSLRSRLYLPTRQPQEAETTTLLDRLVTAPKLRQEHKLVDFERMGSGEIERRYRALESLAGYVDVDGTKVRLKLSIKSKLPPSDSKDMPGAAEGMPVGVPFVRVKQGENLAESAKALDVKAADGKLVEISEITVQGHPNLTAVKAAARAHLFDKPRDLGDCLLYRFKRPVTVN